MAAAASEPLDPGVIAGFKQLGDRGGESILSVIANIFIDEEGPACLTWLQESVQANDSAELAEGAHKLKGGAGQLGASHLRELCAELEAQARRGDTSQAMALVADISAEMARVCAALKAELAS